MAAAGAAAGALRARLPMNGAGAGAGGGVLSRAGCEADEAWDAGCDHCMPLTRDPAKLNDIRLVIRYALAANAPTRKDKGFPIPRCTTCQSCTVRVAACLHCAYFGCANGQGHLHKHLRDRGHMIALDLAHCQLYCHMCRDYVYDRAVDAIVLEEQRRVYDDLAVAPGSQYARRLPVPWTPPAVKMAHLSEYRPQRCSGLRGFYNLGATCFMNSILQTIVHNPLMRAYYLGDQHNPSTCPHASAEMPCLACELTALLAECFSAQPPPLNPHRFLYAMWKHASDLAGYEQQDAHEFFMALLNELHTAELPPNSGPGPAACDCIVHKVFSGMLRSDVVCQACHNVSTSLEPFLDISLDLVHSGEGAPRWTLQECLRRFTGAERLQAKCERCGHVGDATKQYTVRTLPPVLAIHLKRFEHRLATNVKVDGHVAFPQQLDLTPYLSVAAAASDSVDRSFSLRSPSAPSWPQAVPHTYCLFAVINHVGTLESGHYITYVQDRGEWYKIDDDTVVCVDMREVANIEAYMLYYVKQHLDYRA